MKSRILYEQLRDDLVAGRLMPGQRLSEMEISARFSVSRTPVREALVRLEQDGLIRREGTFAVVPVRDAEEIVDLYDIRCSIEGSIARCAALRRGEGDLAMLERAVQIGRAVDPDAPHAELVIGNRAFHDALSQAAHNQVVSDLQHQLDSRVAALPATTLAFPGRWQTALTEHDLILDAVRERDAERAAGLAADHMRRARDIWLDLTRAGHGAA